MFRTVTAALEAQSISYIGKKPRVYSLSLSLSGLTRDVEIDIRAQTTRGITGQLVQLEFVGGGGEGADHHHTVRNIDTDRI